MSWHTSVIFIAEHEPTEFATLLDELGFSGGVPSETLGFDGATTSFVNGKSLAHVDGWTIICDPDFFFHPNFAEGQDIPMQTGLWSASLDAVLRKKSADGGRVFGFVTEGASSTHGFTWYEDGNLTRTYLFQEDEILFDDGAPLSVEFESDEPDQEQRILFMMEELCVGFDVLNATEFQVFQFGGGSA